MRYKKFNRKRLHYLVGFCFIVIIFHEFGLFLIPFEVNYASFKYPLVLDNLHEIIESHIRGDFKYNNASNQISTINEYNYAYTIPNSIKCRLIKDTGDHHHGVGINDDDGDDYGGYGDVGNYDNSIDGNQNNQERVDNGLDADKQKKANQSFFSNKITLVYLIKSALSNQASRDVIRSTWGNEKRFSDVKMIRLFVVGNCEGLTDPLEADRCDMKIKNESRRHGDIVQANFIDTYYNNTIKTMMGMKWIINYCPKAHYIFFVDDDFYISPKNLLKFIRHPYGNPDDLEVARQIPSSFIPKDDRLYAGYVFGNASPMRYKMSKWYTPLSEYPYAKYPPYVTAGAFLLSNRALKEMYYASLYTKHFRFDDIYVGILAKKIALEPFHNKNFYYWRKNYDSLGYSKVIASHGFGNPKELLMVFEEQKSLGHA